MRAESSVSLFFYRGTFYLSSDEMQKKALPGRFRAEPFFVSIYSVKILSSALRV